MPARKPIGQLLLDKGLVEKEQIQRALNKIMDGGEATACQIYRGWDYDGVIQVYGWWYRPFNQQPNYLGKNLSESIKSIERGE